MNDISSCLKASFIMVYWIITHESVKILGRRNCSLEQGQLTKAFAKITEMAMNSIVLKNQEEIQSEGSLFAIFHPDLLWPSLINESKARNVHNS